MNYETVIDKLVDASMAGDTPVITLRTTGNFYTIRNGLRRAFRNATANLEIIGEELDHDSLSVKPSSNDRIVVSLVRRAKTDFVIEELPDE